MKDVLTDEKTQRRCSQCKHVRDLSSYRHAQSDTVETSLCERCRQLKRKRDTQYREERKKEEVTNPDQQKCTHCFHIRDKNNFSDGNKVCNRCTAHARTSYAKMKTAAETMNNAKEQLNYGSSTDKWKKEKRDYVNEIKRSSNGCEECGWFDPNLLEALEFDHLDPNSKNTNIGTMVAEWAFTLDDIDYEIEMCRLVCRKCHRIHSLTQREEYWAELRSQ